ncbi:MAG: PDDEXK nuclease domain-containing protein [Ruminococcus sp.]|nr:PDDEXK nuclease domain-containing protein [Ruminococcus sp.]
MLDVNFSQIVQMIEKRKNNAYRKVNEELILLYLDVGKFLYDIIESSNYGDKITTKFAEFMKNNYPEIKGFTKRNIERMVQFYKIYKDDDIASPLVTQLSWTNNLLILSGSKSIEERHFYLQLSIKENYSKRELNRQLQSSYYERYMLSNGKANKSINKVMSEEEDFPYNKILDLYSLEFLDLPNEFSEKDLKKAIISNLKDFILEIGKGFTFIGDEYRVQVGNRDYFIDLLFYNRELSCLVAFEFKLGEYIPEYSGKMNLYLEALDRNVKQPNENPSVGIILCSSKNKDIVEYSLSKNMSQTLISEYKLKLIDKKLLENKLTEVKRLLENNI